MKVKLLSELRSGDTVHSDGSVVDLPEEQAKHLVELGAAEATDDEVTKEVAPSSAPLEVSVPAGPQSAQVEQPQQIPAQPLTESQPTDGASEKTIPTQPNNQPSNTPEAPASSSTDLHLG